MVNGVGVASCPSVPPGTRIGGYILRERLGQGSEGEVYRAEEMWSGGHRGFKLFHPGVERLAVRRYIRKLERLSGIAGVLVCHRGGHWPQEGRFFVVTGYVAGVTLETLATGQPWSLEAVLRLLLDLSRILAACHRRRIALGPLQPADLLLNPWGRPVILDHKGETRFNRQARQEDLAILLPLCQRLLGDEQPLPNPWKAALNRAARQGDAEPLSSSLEAMFAAR